MFHRHDSNIGVTLFRWNKLQVELWLCLGDVRPHVHENIESTIIWLGGRMLGTIGDRTKQLTWKQAGHRYPVTAGTVHSAKVQTFGLFANIERWKSQPTSACIDFKEI